MTLLRQILRRFGIDRAVSYAMAARIWQIPSGFITSVLMIPLCMDPTQRGVYLLLLTLTGLQALADAGLLNTLLHAASHEMADSRFDARGFLRAPALARRRLSGMLRFAFFWFLAASILLVVSGIVAGYVLLQRKDMLSMGMLPLSAAMILAGMAFLLAPMIAMLEGCNQVQTVNRIRLGQAITGSVTVWLCMLAGISLWAPAAAISVQLGWESSLVFRRYRGFFTQLIRSKRDGFDWRTEIWPLQWRIGVQSMARYLAFFPIFPVLFDTHGPVLAGQYGLTWQVVSGLMMVAYAYVRTRSPEFGRLIAENRRDESRASFRRTTLGSTLLLVVLVSSFSVVLWILSLLDFEQTKTISESFLSPTICLWFAFAVVPIHTTQCFAIYIRSQKFDPIWRVTIPGCLSLAVLAYFAARSGQVVWIAGAMILTFGLSTIALAMMCRWYNKYFQNIEEQTSDGQRIGS